MIVSRRLCCLILLGVVAGWPPVARGQGATVVPRPWRLGDPAPVIEGVGLGDTVARVVSVLGPPAAMPPGLAAPAAPMQTLRYRGGALIVTVSKTAGVVRLLLRRPEGGALAGIRVGDRLGALVRRWGDPPAGGGSVGRYPMGPWTVIVRGDMGTNVVLSIVLANTAFIPVRHPPPPPVLTGH